MVYIHPVGVQPVVCGLPAEGGFEGSSQHGYMVKIVR